MTANRRSAGFLYIEALIALTLVALAILASTPLLLMAAKQNATAGDRTYATNLAMTTIEQMRSVPLPTLTAGTLIDSVELAGVTFERSRTIVDNVPQIGMKRVTVTVRSNRRATFGSVVVTVSAGRAR